MVLPRVKRLSRSTPLLPPHAMLWAAPNERNLRLAQNRPRDPDPATRSAHRWSPIVEIQQHALHVAFRLPKGWWKGRWRLALPEAQRKGVQRRAIVIYYPKCFRPCTHGREAQCALRDFLQGRELIACHPKATTSNTAMETLSYASLTLLRFCRRAFSLPPCRDAAFHGVALRFGPYPLQPKSRGTSSLET